MAIDVALLGCSHPHVADVLGVIATESDLNLAAVWDPDHAIPGAIATAAVRSADAAIARADVVVVCVPTDQRPALAARAAAAGRPVLVEKPIAPTAAAARELATEIERSRTPAAATLFLRDLPALDRLSAVLREGVLGRVSTGHASYGHSGAIEGWFGGPRAWMTDPARAGVGGFGDLGLHLVDAFAALDEREGPPVLGALSLDGSSTGPGDVGGIALGTWNGNPISIQASWATRPGGLQIVIEGSSATATLREGTLEIDRGSGDPERWIGAPPDAGTSLRSFVRRLRARATLRDGLRPAVAAQLAIERALPVG